MRWCLPFAVLLGLSFSDAGSQARGQGGAQRPAAGRQGSGLDELSDAGFFATTGVVRFQLVSGRLQLDAPRHRKGSQSRDQDGVFESITVTALRGIPSLHYVCQTQDQHITLSVQRAVHVRIESFLPKTGERAILDQPAGGEIRWAVQRGELKDDASGTTLLHIRSQDAAGFDLHCGELVRRLLRRRSLCAICKSTNREIINRLSTQSVAPIQSTAVQRCVEGLSSRKLSVRRASEKQLLRWGTPIIPIVNSMNRDDLDAEQSGRLRLILKRLERIEDDTAASLATMLATDQSYWQCISTKLSTEQVAQANGYLNQIGLRPLEIPSDPVTRIADRSR